MSATYIFNNYKLSAFNARILLNNYKKIHNCLAVRSLDDQIHEVFSKVALVYSQLIIRINTDKTTDNPLSQVPVINATGDFDALMVEKSLFFDYVIIYLDQNKNQIIETLEANADSWKFDYDLSRLKFHLNQISDIVHRLESMAKSSQNIHINTRLTA
jgi:hypothetical protein